MTTRKRKSPDRKKAVRQPGLLPTLIKASGRAAARHPKPLMGIAVFGVVFSFVAANALWYQPGNHPHPFLATRDASDPNQIAGYRPMRRPAPEDVTTFRIERADPDAPATVPQTTPVARPATEPPPQMAIPAAAPVHAPAEQQAGTQPLGQPAIQEQQPAAPVVALPTPRPSSVEPQRTVMAKPPQQPMPPQAKPAQQQAKPAQPNRGDDPIAAAIRSSERSPFRNPPADIPNTGSTPRAAIPVSQRPGSAVQTTDLVLQIQRGLSNIAYADVEVDGVAGEQTKAAIRRFQRHYRLPETGEPDALVLRKLKSIGAL
jgi:hypothetical protein